MKLEIFELFDKALELNASDLILKPGAPPSFRLNKHLVISEDKALAPQQMYDLFLPLIDAEQQDKLKKDKEISAIFQYRYNKSRIRYYIYQQRDGFAASFRFIKMQMPGIEELNLPKALINIASKPRGIFFVTGPGCSGKTSTVAALANAINRRFAKHIITIEEPTEIIYTPQKAVFTQIEVGTTIPTYYQALTNALRQDPDVIIIGELKRRETMEQALTAAETGHMVFTSIPTTGAAQTIEHIVSMYPPAKQEEARLQISSNLVGIFSQLLIPSIDIYQPPRLAYELMITNSGMQTLIRDKKYNQLETAMIMGKKEGCVTFKESLEQLKMDETVDLKTVESYLEEWKNA